MPFMFEKLEVYRKAMGFVVRVYGFRGLRNSKIIDQLQRAALSVPLNISEGQGRAHSREKRQYYNTAKASLYECVPIMQICKELGYIDDSEYQTIYNLMNEIGKMLAGLIRSVGEHRA